MMDESLFQKFKKPRLSDDEVNDLYDLLKKYFEPDMSMPSPGERWLMSRTDGGTKITIQIGCEEVQVVSKSISQSFRTQELGRDFFRTFKKILPRS